jgi:hypothetical protein
MVRILNSKLAAVALALTGIVLTAAVMAALSDSTSIPFNGTINTVGVEAYSDSACTQLITALDVGNVDPGSSVTQIVYIKNSGSIPVRLSMAASGWSPSGASSYLSLSWNRPNYLLNAGASVSATLTLTVAADTGSLTTFSCTVTITGTEQ